MTYGIDMDLWYRQGLMVLTTPIVLTKTHGIESVILNHTRTRGPSVTRMRDFFYRGYKIIWHYKRKYVASNFRNFGTSYVNFLGYAAQSAGTVHQPFQVYYVICRPTMLHMIFHFTTTLGVQAFRTCMSRVSIWLLRKGKGLLSILQECSFPLS